MNLIERMNQPKPNIELYDFQKQGVEFLVNTRRCILADEMGLGKTAQAIFAAEKLNAKRVLIVCPSTLKHIWENELEKFIGEFDVEVVNAPIFEMREMQIKSGCKFTIMNYEQLGERISRHAPGIKVTEYNKKALEEKGAITVDRRHLPTLCNIKWDLIIADEAHKIKNRETASFKGFREVVEKSGCKNVFFLTGTPILNRPDEMWTLMHIINPTMYHSFWSWFRNECYSRTRFRAAVDPILLRREKKDVLSLPEKIYQDITVDLEGSQRRTYDSIRDNMYVELSEDLTVETVCALAQIIRMKQIAVSEDLLMETDRIEGAKINALDDIIEGAGDQKIVVFSQFARAIKRLHKKYKTSHNAVILTGDNNDKQRAEAIHTFQNDPKCKIILSSIQAGGVGITLTAGSIAVFLDLMWTPALNGQAADRLHRVGQKNTVQIITLTAANTIESYIQSVLASKEAMFNALIPTTKINEILHSGFTERKF